MELEKAIKILTYSLPADTWKLKEDSKDAIKLGIEALKEKVERRRRLSLAFEPTLLGGTRENPGHAHFHQPALVDVDKRSRK